MFRYSGFTRCEGQQKQPPTRKTMTSKNRHFNLATTPNGFVKFGKNRKVLLEITMATGKTWDFQPNNEKDMQGMIDDLLQDIKKGFVKSFQYKVTEI